MYPLQGMHRVLMAELLTCVSSAFSLQCTKPLLTHWMPSTTKFVAGDVPLSNTGTREPSLLQTPTPGPAATATPAVACQLPMYIHEALFHGECMPVASIVIVNLVLYLQHQQPGLPLMCAALSVRKTCFVVVMKQAACNCLARLTRLSVMFCTARCHLDYATWHQPKRQNLVDPCAATKCINMLCS